MLLASIILLSSSCRKAPVEPPAKPEGPDVVEVIIPEYVGVDTSLWVFYYKFEQEAKLRGFEIDLNEEGITGEIEEIEQPYVAGQCTYNSAMPNHVTIDKEFWATSSEVAREFVIFHELGHCNLLRGHREDAYPDGSCKSIMRSGLEGCSDNYNNYSRATYLDELFDPDSI